MLDVNDTWKHFVIGAKSIDKSITASETPKDEYGFSRRSIHLDGETWELHCLRDKYYFHLYDPLHKSDSKYNFKFHHCETAEEAEEHGKEFVSFARRPERKKNMATAQKDVASKRAAIEKMIYDTVQLMDPSGDNTTRWKNIFAKMDDKQFAEFMEHLAKKECQLNIVMPNMKKVPKIPDLLKAADKVGLKLAHRLWLPDKTRPGKRYLTNESYLVLELPIRRAQQEWDKKLQVPSRDTHVDALTGQVIMDDRACHLSTPEIQSLSTRGLDATLTELVKVRGGDVVAYGDFKRQLEESGEARLESLDPRTRARSGILAKVLLQSMMLDNNL